MELTDRQRHTLKTRLEQRFYELRQEIAQELLASDEAPYIELAGQVHDTAEAAVADLLKDVKLADVNRHIAEIRAIDAALLRIAEGIYGVCIDCEEAIDHQRLEVEPTAARCLKCQTKWEEKPTARNQQGPSL